MHAAPYGRCCRCRSKRHRVGELQISIFCGRRSRNSGARYSLRGFASKTMKDGKRSAAGEALLQIAGKMQAKWSVRKHQSRINRRYLRWLAGEMDCQPPRHCKQQGKNNAVVNNKEKTMPFQLSQSGSSLSSATAESLPRSPLARRGRWSPRREVHLALSLFPA